MQPVRRKVGGAPRNVRTVEHEEAVLNVFEEDGTRSIRTVSREMGLSKSSVQRVLADNRRHPYHYTRVQQLVSSESTTFERATKESRNMSAATKERHDKRAPRQKSAATK
ncbi:hypothetical protein MTP99_017317 [Tenebrio molitor]|nr:hypothetical protein MTP99_017317 [Tenebrio molitor]